MTALDAFISYSRSDQKWAEKLNRSLEARGLSTFIDSGALDPAIDWREQMKQAVHGAQNIVVLVGSDREPDEHQRREVSALLEAVWSDPSKRLIPILLRHTKPPTFVRSASGGEVQALRVEDPRRDWDKVMENLVQVLQGKVPLDQVAETIDTRTEDRARQEERLSYIRDVAESFDTVSGK